MRPGFPSPVENYRFVQVTFCSLRKKAPKGHSTRNPTVGGVMIKVLSRPHWVDAVFCAQWSQVVLAVGKNTG